MSGEDTDLLEIAVSHMQDMGNLSIAMARAEHMSVVSEDMSIVEEAQDSFLRRMIDGIKEIWSRIVEFFKSLWDRFLSIFIDREKWIDNNKDAIERGARESRAMLPRNFSKMNSMKWIEIAEGDVEKLMKMASRAASSAEAYTRAEESRWRGDYMRRIKDLIKAWGYDRLSSRSRGPIDYARIYDEALGVPVLTPLKGVIKVAMREARATKTAKRALRQVEIAQGEALRGVKEQQKRKEGDQSLALLAINQCSLEASRYIKSLHNTILKICGYGWSACRIAARKDKTLHEWEDPDLLPVII